MSEAVFEYKKYNDGIMVTKFLEGPEVVEVPGEFEGQKVVAIGSECFRENGIMVTEIKLPDTVKELMSDAFSYTVSLERLSLPEGLEVIGADYLLASGLKEAYIPASVEHIERPELIDRGFNVSADNKKYFSDGYGLYERKGKDICLIAVNASEAREVYDIKDGTKEIAFNALRDAATIECLNIPASLSVIREGTLSYNGGVVNEGKGVKRVKISEKNTCFKLISDMLCEKLEDGSLKVIRYFGKEKANIPGDVTVIGFESFKNTGVNELYIPESVKQINTGAFAGCPVKNCDIGGTKLCFGDEDRFTMEAFLESFGKDGKIYDFNELDFFLLEQYLTPGRIRMICTRLKYNLDLTKEKRAGLARRIEDELKKAVEMLSEAKDIQTIEVMGEIGFFTDDNIDEIIELMGKNDKKEFTAWFMSYKNRNLKGKGGFNFML